MDDQRAKDPTPQEMARDAAKRLGLVVEQEARRTFTETQLAPDPARVAAGWERRFVTDATRAHEAMDLYEELGYEVCADPVQAESLEDECRDCWLVTQLRFVTIYTRKKGREGHEGTKGHGAGG